MKGGVWVRGQECKGGVGVRGQGCKGGVGVRGQGCKEGEEGERAGGARYEI